MGWMALWCFALTTVSAIVPWVNAEVIVLSLPAVAKSRADLIALVLVATAGQMLGKGVVYWVGRGSGQLPTGRVREARDRWCALATRRPWSPLAFVLLSSTVGVPPFYVMSLVAGALRVCFGAFLLAGTCGRLLRFGTLALVPGLVLQWLK